MSIPVKKRFMFEKNFANSIKHVDISSSILKNIIKRNYSLDNVTGFQDIYTFKL